MSKNSIRIGTRGSVLAMWQAVFVKEQLENRHVGLDVEIHTIKTQGDIIRDVALAALPGKSFFTKEIEDALLSGEVDLAVHSGKDVPTELPEGLELFGFLKRHSPLDAWISTSGATFEALPAGSRVGTSSLRRRALVAATRPDLVLDDLRGNVDTRLRKLEEGRYDAIILAAAGLERLGLTERVTEFLDPERFPPAVSQGAIALEIRADDGRLAKLITPAIDADTTGAARAERSLLATLEGGCQVPLGALARVVDDELEIVASLLSPDGTERIDARRSGDPTQAEQLGITLAETLLSQGGDEILKMIRDESSNP